LFRGPLAVRRDAGGGKLPRFHLYSFFPENHFFCSRKKSNMEQPLYSSRRFSFNVIGYLFLAIFNFSLAVGFAFTMALSGVALKLFLCGLFSLFGCVLLSLVLFKTNIYEVYPDYIRIVSFLGREKKRIMRSQFRSWSETEMSTRRGTMYTLILYTDSQRIKIVSGYLMREDYLVLKEQLTQGLPENIKAELQHAIKQSNRAGFVFGIILFLLIPGFIKLCYSGLNNLQTGIFRKVIKHASNEPYVYRNNRGEGSLYIDLKDSLGTITIDDYAFKATQADKFAKEIHEGDTITFDMVKPRYTNAFAAFFGSGEELICSISAHNIRYMKTGDFMFARKNSNERLIWLFMLFPFLLLLAHMANKRRVVMKRKQLEELEKSNA
jgi:hypothetical protein